MFNDANYPALYGIDTFLCILHKKTNKRKKHILLLLIRIDRFDKAFLVKREKKLNYH